MLTKRQNLLETIKGGNPDRFVKQYEFMNLIMEASVTMAGFPAPGQTS
ncbi:MAG TPA: uroporphyrinogen decarboxylase, partial [Desulfitobacterium dehalogenans]|nr:uroporphyrinogen decarboxylase [Desulfitobacterium dehalogenans]